MARLFAALIAVIAWAALGIQFYATFSANGSVPETFWILLRFFTIITNLLVAMFMTAVAMDRRMSPFLIGGLALAISLVGIVYMTLLRGLVHLEGPALLADTLLHYVVPIAMAIYWLVVAPKFGLRWHHPILWSLYPLAYFGYAILRGSIDGRYPYPFMDVTQLGAGQTALNALGLAASSVIAGLLMVAYSRFVGRNQTRPLG